MELLHAPRWGFARGACATQKKRPAFPVTALLYRVENIVVAPAGAAMTPHGVEVSLIGVDSDEDPHGGDGKHPVVQGVAGTSPSRGHKPREPPDSSQDSAEGQLRTEPRFIVGRTRAIAPKMSFGDLFEVRDGSRRSRCVRMGWGAGAGDEAGPQGVSARGPAPRGACARAAQGRHRATRDRGALRCWA